MCEIGNTVLRDAHEKMRVAWGEYGWSLLDRGDDYLIVYKKKNLGQLEKITIPKDEYRGMTANDLESRLIRNSI